MNPPLQLPFADDFDQGLRSEWRVINGRTLVSDGRLTSAVDEVSLELGNRDLKNYTLEFDYSSKNPKSCFIQTHFIIRFSPTLRFDFGPYGGINRTLRWEAYDSGKWEIIDRQQDLDCGRFEIEVSGNFYRVWINGQLESDLIFEPAQGPLLIKLDDGVFIDNFVIR